MREKLTYISNARIIGVLLVVFGHSYPLTGEIPKFFDIIRNFIYCFHMPLFVFVSGYLVVKANSVEKYGAKSYLERRFVKLFVPYLGLSILGYFPKVLVSGFINDEVKFGFWYFIKTLLIPREGVWGHFWFIPMLFAMAVVSVIYMKFLRQNRKLAIFVCILSFGLIYMPDFTEWLGVNDIKDYLFWYLSGVLFADVDILGKHSSLRSGIVCLLSACVAFTVFGMKAYNAVVAIFMVIGVLMICAHMDLRKIKILGMIENYSFSIFLLSWPVQAVVEVVFNRIISLSLPVINVGMFLSGLLIPLVVVYIMGRMKKIPYIKNIELLLGI